MNVTSSCRSMNLHILVDQGQSPGEMALVARLAERGTLAVIGSRHFQVEFAAD